MGIGSCGDGRLVEVEEAGGHGFAGGAVLDGFGGPAGRV